MKNFAKNFKGKFQTLSEQAIERFQQGGYVNGDYVTLVKNYKSSDFYKKAGAHTQAIIDEWAASDLNIRVSAVKAIRPAIAPVDGGMNAADGYYLDLAQEIAPGLYPKHVTLPAEMVQLVDTPDAMGRISPPESQVYKANIHGAEEVETSDADRSNAKKDTKLPKANKWQDAPGGGNAPGKTVFGESLIDPEEGEPIVYKGKKIGKVLEKGVADNWAYNLKGGFGDDGLSSKEEAIQLAIADYKSRYEKDQTLEEAYSSMYEQQM